jgi:ComF family protein
VIEKMIKYMWKELKSFKKEDFIVLSTPMSFLRKIKRWYNHSDILAQSIATSLQFNYKKDIILKNKRTRQQSKLSRQERLINLKEAFKIHNKYIDIIDNKIVILVDDVVSTWATVNEISKVLKERWSKKIIILILASD